MKGLKDKNTGRFVKNIEDKKCIFCDSVFIPRHNKQKFCDRGCFFANMREESSKICLYCKNKFWKLGIANRKFCNSQCYGKYLEENKIMNGEKCHLWKGGITPLNTIIRTSRKYKNWRKQIFERDNYTCQKCKIRGGKLNVDHIKPFALFPELRFEITNGQTLCVDCHKQTPTYLKRLTIQQYANINI